MRKSLKQLLTLIFAPVIMVCRAFLVAVILSLLILAGLLTAATIAALAAADIFVFMFGTLTGNAKNATATYRATWSRIERGLCGESGKKKSTR